MKPVPCLCCGTFFVPRNKDQQYCSKPACRRKRKARWQKEKLAIDPDYKETQRLSNNKWHENNPDYWKQYRDRNPKKAERNRLLQKNRNMKQKKKQAQKSSNAMDIAKMDAGKSKQSSDDNLSGEYWLVPIIAKMDARKIFITCVPGNSP